MSSLILASASPRRQQLLQWAEVPFTVQVSGTDESYPHGLKPFAVAEHIALQKAIAVHNQLQQDAVVIAADTIVVLHGEIIGKPVDRTDAVNILSKLNGHTHEVITGVVIKNAHKKNQFHDRTLVSFHTLTQQQIEFYVDKYQPYDKAGAYAIQEWIGVVGIKSVTGDFYNVMGLPVSRVVQALATFK